MIEANMDIIGIMLAAAIAGIGSGVGVAIGQALYKALLEEKINKFLDKKHREEALKKLKDMDPARKILYGDTIPTREYGEIPPRPSIPQRPTSINSQSVIDKMLR